MDHVHQEHRLHTGQASSDAAENLWMRPVSHDDSNTARAHQRPQRPERAREPQGLAKTGAREVDHLCARAAETRRQIAIAEAEAHDQAAAPQLVARGEQVQKGTLGSSHLRRRLNEKKITIQ